MSFFKTLSRGMRCRCPRCYQGRLYSSLTSFHIVERCEQCGLDLSRNDSADGPAVFLIFILGFTLVPPALWLSMTVDWPLFVHAALWSAVILGCTLALLKPLKSYVITLQYQYRPEDMEHAQDSGLSEEERGQR